MQDVAPNVAEWGCPSENLMTGMAEAQVRRPFSGVNASYGSLLKREMLRQRRRPFSLVNRVRIRHAPTPLSRWFRVRLNVCCRRCPLLVRG